MIGMCSSTYAGGLAAISRDWLQSTEMGGLDIEIGYLAKFIALSCHCMVRTRTYVPLKLLHETHERH